MPSFFLQNLKFFKTPFGRVVYTVLSEKGALISEDRVKNLTDAQWLFHYAEIQHKRRNTAEEESNVIGIILDRIESMLCDNAIFSRTD